MKPKINKINVHTTTTTQYTVKVSVKDLLGLLNVPAAFYNRALVYTHSDSLELDDEIEVQWAIIVDNHETFEDGEEDGYED